MVVLLVPGTGGDPAGPGGPLCAGGTPAGSVAAGTQDVHHRLVKEAAPPLAPLPARPHGRRQGRTQGNTELPLFLLLQEFLLFD